MPYPPNHDERMEVLNATTASHSGWGRDTTMTMIEKRCVLALSMAQEVLAGKQPLLPGLIRTFIELCALLNIERNGDHREAATRLLAQMHEGRDLLRRLWAMPSFAEVQQQLSLVEPLYKRVNDRLNATFAEVRSESVAEDCKQLGHALRLRKAQLAERSPLQARAV